MGCEDNIAPHREIIMSIERQLVKGVTTTDVAEVVKVNECIRYIESCGWLLKQRARGYYYFRNENANEGQRDMTFSLAELREAYHNGW
jgi:hypothetical protein